MASNGRLSLDRRGVPAGARLYMGLSGGIDSAYLAWRLLARGHRLLLHHATYRTRQHRWPHETVAHRAVLDWLTAQGLTGWQLITSEYASQGSIPYWHLDYEYLLWIAGMHLRIHPRSREDRSDIQYIVIPSRAESRGAFGNRDFDRAWRMFEYNVRRPILALQPMRRYSKQDIIGDMPEDLFARTWWCREPDDGEPCHQCHTCRDVDAALAALGRDLPVREQEFAP